MRPRFVTKRREDFGHTHFRIVDIALQFAGALGLLHLAAIGIDDGVTRILPVHIFVPQRGVGFVLLEAVTIQIAVVINPIQTTFRHLAILSEQVHITRPAVAF